MTGNEVLLINTTDQRFFLEYLTIKKPVFEALLTKVNGFRVKLSPGVLHVFAILLYFNNKYREHEEDVKWNLLFDYSTKLFIMNAVNINKQHLNTYISYMRKIRLLNGRKINKPFIFYPDNGFELTFKFNITPTISNGQQGDSEDN